MARPGVGRYYFVETVLDSEGNESDYRNEVPAHIKPKPPTLKSLAQRALAAPFKALDMLANFFRGKKQLRIVR
jgi:hypothetical protein